MTRQERNKIRRRRNKARAAALLACFLFFLAGVSITYDVMSEVLGLSRNNSILSFQNTGQALRDITGEIPEVAGMLRKTVKQIFAQIQSLLREAYNWISTIRG
ncbi:MAG TPA: hypothetical protein GX505_05705 [Clostridiales bacterium]|nr:hypothetical protein [Clostridiales bacterium]